MDINYKSHATKLVSLGYEPLAIRPESKVPIDKSWSSIPITAESVAEKVVNVKAEVGIGIRCGTGNKAVYAADFDFYDIDVTKCVAKSFFDHFGKGPIRIGQMPKALAVYCGNSGQSKIQVSLISPDGVCHKFELLGAGQQFVAYGIHPDTKKAYTWQKGGLDLIETCGLPELDFDKVNDWVNTVLPKLVPSDWVLDSKKAKSIGTKPFDAFESHKPPLDGWSLQRVIDDILSNLDPSMGHDDWIKVGMALHHQSRGDSEWLAAWDIWSSMGNSYKDGECKERWSSFSNKGRAGNNVVTLATFVKLTKEAREKDVTGEIVLTSKNYQEQIDSAINEKALRKVASNIYADKHLDALARDLLVGPWSAKHKELLKTKNPPQVNIVRALLGVNAKKSLATSSDMPLEFKQWVYCASIDKFFNLDTKEQLTKQGFRARFDRLFDLAHNGKPESAFDKALTVYDMPVVYKLEYAPFFGSTYTREGVEFANLYRVSSAPVAAGPNLSEDDETKISYVMDHFVVTIPNSEYRKLFLQWCAHNVVKPGIKIRWAPVEVGIEGDGKSLKGSLLRVAMGSENVGEVSSSVLTESIFTDFALGKAVTIIEELRLQGNNRLDVMNKLKTYITNDLIEVHQKGIKAIQVLNTCNYLGFSNHRDCLALTDTDRRWMLLFTPWAHINEFIAKVKEHCSVSMETYWSRLWAIVNNRPDLCREFFERIDLSDFDPNGRAPHTIFKDMVDHPEGSAHSETAAELIDQGCYGVSYEVVDSASFSAAMSELSPPVILSTSQVRNLLLSTKKLCPLPKTQDGKRKQIQWDGKARNIWLSPESLKIYESEGVDGIKRLLDATKIASCHKPNYEEDFLK